MKKYSATLILLFVLALSVLSFLPCGKIASADDGLSAGGFIYASPANLTGNASAGISSVAVCDQDTGDTLFYLPETYYARIKSVNTRHSYYVVEYDDLEKPVSIDFDNASAAPEEYSAPASATAPAVTLTVRTGATVTMTGTDGNDLDMTAATFKYYGENGTDVYVKAMLNDDTLFGLVPKASFNDFTVSYHAVSQAVRDGLLSATPDETTVTDDGGKTSVTLRIILIIGIIIPAVLIAVLLFKPNRETSGYDKRAMRQRPNKRSDYDRDRRYGDAREDRDYDERGYRNDRDRDRRDYDRRLGDDGRDYDRRGYDRRDYDDRR